MPYKVKGNCVYRKDTNKKVGCTKGSVKKYLAALHANADESTEPKETLSEMKGGLADGKTPQEIADKHGVPISKINHQIAMGKKVEMEHTDNSTLAKEIAMDHLFEIPDYYTRLASMEKKAEKSLDESTQQLIKRLIRENLGLYPTDETPDTTKFKLLIDQKPVGTITVAKASKNFGKDTMEIINIFLRKDVNHLEIAKKAIIHLFEKYPDINRFLMQPTAESRDFWYKLDGQRIDKNYMIIFRAH